MNLKTFTATIDAIREANKNCMILFHAILEDNTLIKFETYQVMDEHNLKLSYMSNQGWIHQLARPHTIKKIEFFMI